MFGISLMNEGVRFIPKGHKFIHSLMFLIYGFREPKKGVQTVVLITSIGIPPHCKEF